MPYLRKAAVEVLPTAKAQRWDPAEVVRVLLEEEARGRDPATIANRRKRAGFPTGKTFESWCESSSTIPAATQQALRSLEWIDRAENLAVVGPSGTGKSHLLEALGNAAVDPARRSRGSPSRRSGSSCAVTAPATPSPRPSTGCCAPTSWSSTTSACCPCQPKPPKRCSASSTPPTNDGRSRSPATPTPAGSISCYPPPSPPPRFSTSR